MLISTSIISLRGWGDNKAILQLLKNAGFDAYDFTMYDPHCMDCFNDKEDYIERAKDLRAYADSIGIVCNQSHALFPTYREGNAEWDAMADIQIKRGLEVTGILGGKCCVIHPQNDYSLEKNVEMFKHFLPTAKKANVKIALENMWNWDKELGHAVFAACSDCKSFCDHMDALEEDKEWFTACLDIGHAEMKGLGTSAVKMIKALGNRLGALHLHDNDRHHDNHRMPYTYGIDFEPIIDALAEIDYQGDITFEADGYPCGFPIKLLPEAMGLMAAIGKYIRDEVIARKKK